MQEEDSPKKEVFTRPLLGLALGILATSTAAIFIRQAQAQAPSLVVAAARLTLASLILMPMAFKNRQEIISLQRKQWLLALASGAILALHFATWISSLEYTSVASSVVLVTTTPLWVAIFSPIFLKERMGKAALIGLGVAFLGGVIVGLSDACHVSDGRLACGGFQGYWGGRAALGNLLALVGAWMAAGYMLIGRRLRPGLSLVTYIFLVYGVAAFVLLGMVGISGLPLVGYSPAAYGWFLALAAIPQLIGHSSFNWALRYLPASFVSVSLLGEPIGSILLAFIFLAERPSRLELLGGAMILMGIFIASRFQKA